MATENTDLITMEEPVTRKGLTSKQKKQIWGLIFVTPWLIGFLMFFAYPLFRSLWFSFNNVKPEGTKLVIEFVGLGKYEEAFGNVLYAGKSFQQVIIESVYDTLLNLPVLLIFSLFIAVLLNTEFKGRAIARAIFFVPVIFNSAAIEVALGGGEAMRAYLESSGQDPDQVFQGFQLEQFLLQTGIGEGFITFLTDVVNRIYTIISYSGVQILIFLAGIQSIPGHLYEAARIEGATSYEIFWKITLPMVSPLILTATVYTIIDSFMNSPVTQFITRATNDSNYGLASAEAWVYFGVNVIILGIAVAIARLGVFYYDE